MNGLNIFCYMYSSFMRILDPLIQRVHTLRLADFAEYEDDVESQTHDGKIHHDLNRSQSYFW